MRRISWGPSLVLGVCLLLPLAGVGAGETQDALLNRGIELRIAGDDEGALREFEKAVAMGRSPKAVAQVGLAEQALGRWEAADVHLTEALRAADEPWIKRNRKTLDDAMDVIKKHVARVEVVVDPAGAEVLVNGKSVGRAPLAAAVRVSAGEVSVEARAPGYRSENHRVNVVGGQYQNVVLRLEKALALEEKTRSAEPEGMTLSRDESSSVRPILKWTSLGLGATGVVATFIHASKVSKFDNAANMGCSEMSGRAVYRVNGLPASECQGPLDAYLRARTVQIVGFAAGGVFLTSWLVLWLTEDPVSSDGRKDASLPRWTCSPSFGPGQMSCAMLF